MLGDCHTVGVRVFYWRMSSNTLLPSWYTRCMFFIKVRVHSMTICYKLKIPSEFYQLHNMTFCLSHLSLIIVSEAWQGGSHCFLLLGWQKYIHFHPQLQFHQQRRAFWGFDISCLQMCRRHWVWSWVSSWETPPAFVHEVELLCSGTRPADKVRGLVFACCSTISSKASTFTT